MNSSLEVLTDKNGRYSHWSICQQKNVGSDIASLLKGEQSKFTVFDSKVYEQPKPAGNAANNAALSPEDTDNSQTVRITVTAAEPIQNDVYCTFGNEDDCRFFKMPVSDNNRTKFEAVLNATELFKGMDTGTIEILYVSCMSEDADILGMYISNTVNIPSLADLNGANIVRLDISELSALTMAEGSQTPAELYAVDSDGKYYDVSSPLAGTVWTSSNQDIAYVDESGVIHALSSGTAVLQRNIQASQQVSPLLCRSQKATLSSLKKIFRMRTSGTSYSTTAIMTAANKSAMKKL